MRSHRIVSITTTDGATLGVLQERYPGRSYGVQFHTTFTEATADLALRITNGATLRLLLILPHHLSYEAFKRLNQTAVGSQLGIDNSTVSRGMNELHSLGVVERKGKGPVTEWRLSSDYGWCGNVDSFHQHRRQNRRGTPGTPPLGQPSIAAEGILWKAVAAQTSSTIPS